MNKSPALLLSVFSRQHGNNSRRITCQRSAVAWGRVILEYVTFDILLANIKRLCWHYKLWNEVMFWFTQMMCYNVYIPLLIRQLCPEMQGDEIYALFDKHHKESFSYSLYLVKVVGFIYMYITYTYSFILCYTGPTDTYQSCDSRGHPV